PPYVIDPANDQRLLLGTDRVYETTNKGATWTAISKPMTNGWTIDAPIDWVAAAPANANVIYASSAGRIFVTTNDGPSWTLATSPGGTSVTYTQLITDPANANTVFAVAGA